MPNARVAPSVRVAIALAVLAFTPGIYAPVVGCLLGLIIEHPRRLSKAGMKRGVMKVSPASVLLFLCSVSLMGFLSV